MTPLPCTCSKWPRACTRLCWARPKCSGRSAGHASGPKPTRPPARCSSSLFRRAVQVGRRVRAQTAIAKGTTSLSHVAVDVAAGAFGGSLAGKRVLVVGAGDMGEGVVTAAAGAGPASIVVANRTTGRAESLARAVGGTAIGLDEIAAAVADADAVLVSTGASLPVIDTELLADAVTKRAKDGDIGKLVVVDLGVPRNVEPAVAELTGVELFDMDDLRLHAEKALVGRRAELGRGAGDRRPGAGTLPSGRTSPRGGPHRLCPAGAHRRAQPGRAGPSPGAPGRTRRRPMAGGGVGGARRVGQAPARAFGGPEGVGRYAEGRAADRSAARPVRTLRAPCPRRRRPTLPAPCASPPEGLLWHFTRPTPWPVSSSRGRKLRCARSSWCAPRATS